MDIIAHRGASHAAPENTVAAIRLAWEEKADGLEVDVRLTRDGAIVAMHDDSPKRTGGVDRKISDLTLREVKSADVGAWKGAQWAGERIPTIREILDALPENKRVFIEIKCGGEIAPPLRDAIRASGKRPEQIVLIGFSRETMKTAKQAMPEYRAYLLSGFKRQDETGPWSPPVDELIRSAADAKLDGLDLSFKGPIDEALATKVAAAGLGFYIWTVNDGAVARRMSSLGVGAITTDRPAYLRRELRGWARLETAMLGGGILTGR